ncbi:MAG: tetratricopeptide repeat protein [Gemmatimonadota bacterium]
MSGPEGAKRPPKRLTDRDTANHVFQLTLAVRIGPPVMVFLMAVEFLYFRNRFIWFVIPDIALTALVVIGADWLLGHFSRGGGSLLFPSGRGTPVAREYSEQDALIIRGQYEEAADAFRAIIADDPTDIEAQLRLGRLQEKELNDPAAAVGTFRRIRWLTPTPQQEWVAANALIDLYQRTGQRDDLCRELERLIQRHPTTVTAANAQRRLAELRSAEPDSATAPPSAGERGPFHPR